MLLLSVSGCRPATQPPAASRNGGLSMPDGFEATVFHEGVGRARHLAVTPDGAVYVKLRGPVRGQTPAEFKGVVGLKDTGGDAVLQTELMQREGDVPVLLNGWDTLTFAALAAGSRGVVWGAASFMPAECVALHRLLIEELDLAAARELWSRLWPICAFLESTSYAAAVKSACRSVGLTTGPVRGPLLDLSEADAARLAGLLEAAGIATAVPAGR